MSKPVTFPKRTFERLTYIVAIADEKNFLVEMRKKRYELVNSSYDWTGFNKELTFEKYYNVKY